MSENKESNTQNGFEEIIHVVMKMEQSNKLAMYQSLNKFVVKGETLFVGSSLMENFPINEMNQVNEKKCIIYNRGIGGFVTTDLLEVLDPCIFELEPSRVFINIGTNDIAAMDYTLEKLQANYDNILSQIKLRLPDAKVYVMAYYPVNPFINLEGISAEQKEKFFKNRTNFNIQLANEANRLLANKYGYEYIDVNDGLSDENGNLKAEFTKDGVHMLADGYKIVLENLVRYL